MSKKYTNSSNMGKVLRKERIDMVNGINEIIKRIDNTRKTLNDMDDSKKKLSESLELFRGIRGQIMRALDSTGDIDI